MATTPGETEIGGEQRVFQSTLWTLVLRAGNPAAPERRQALEALIRAYWKPIYFHIRRKGRTVEDAKDLAQAFFARLFESDVLLRADRAKGRFRTLLLGVLDHQLCDDFDRERLRSHKPLEVDFAGAETEFCPEHTFERDWALAVLERAFTRLTAGDPKAEILARVLQKQDVSYSEVARELGTTEENVKVQVHRARKKLREILLDELRATVERPGEEVEELRDLFRAFSP